MKKRLVLLCILLIQLLAVIPAYAADIKATSPTVTIDGKKLTFTVDPIIEDGTTLVQFRPIFEKLGLEIKWDGVNQRITGTKADLKIELTIGSLTAVVNGKEIPLQKAPKLVKENTVIPLRFVGEASGKDVGWDAATQRVSIKDKATGEAGKNSEITSANVNSNASNSNALKPNELKTFLLTTSRKQENVYTATEVNTLNKVLAMDKTELFEILVSQYDYKLSPASPTTDNIIQFIKKYLINDLQKLVDYSLSVSESTEKGYAINQILNWMPGAPNYNLPDEANFRMLSEILEKHPNPDVRYDMSYNFNRYKNEEVFNEVLKVLAIEKNDLVFGSVAGVAIMKADIDLDKMLLLFNEYNHLTDSQKYKYNEILTNTVNRDLELKFTWKTFLDTKANTGSDIDKKNAAEIADFVLNGKAIPLYPAGSDGARIQSTMKQYTDSYTNKDMDAYISSLVKVEDAEKKELIKWYKDYSSSNYRYTINNFDIVSIDGNTAKAKVGYLVQSLSETQFLNPASQEVQKGWYVSSQAQFVSNVTFTKLANGDWKIANFDRTNFYNLFPDKRSINLE